MAPPTEEDSKDKDLLTAELDDQVWPEDPVPDSQEYLCIHEIPRLATPPSQTPPQPIPATPSLQLNQELPVTPLLQPHQVERP